MKEQTSLRNKLAALRLALRWTYQASPGMTVLVIFLSIFGGLLTIVEPYLFKLLIDQLTGNSVDGILQRVGFGIVGILVVYACSRILQNIFWDVQQLIKRVHGMRLEKFAAYQMMEKVSSLDIVYFETPEYYNTLTRANSNLYRILELFWQMTFFISELVSVVVILTALSAYSWIIVLVVLLGAIPGVFLAVRASENIWSAFMESSPISRQAHYYRAMMTEQVQALKEIRLFGLREHFLKKFDALFGSFLKKQAGAMRSELKWFLLIAFIEGSLSVIGAWFVVRMFTQTLITLGELTMLWSLLFQFAAHMRWTVRMTHDIHTHTIFLTPLLQLLGFEPLVKEATSPVAFPANITKGIEFRNVTFRYPGARKPVLKNVSFRIGPHESVAIVGENGSGKTTLIKLLCRLYDVTHGDILIDGVSIKNYALDELYAHVGVIFQDFMKYEAQVKENIGFGNLRNMHVAKEIHAASVQSEAWNFIKDLDLTYKTQLGKRLSDKGTDLSVGQWQKIALARAFFRDAPVIILDEPTAAVDARAEYNLFKKFRTLTKNKMTVLISHRFSTVRMADRIIVLEKGVLQESGSHHELLRRNGTYAKLFRLQAEGYR